MDHIVGNAFTYFWSKGYRNLLPVIPAGTPGVGSPGKCPGVKLANGKWQGRDRKIFNRVDEKQLMMWSGWGAGVGLRCHAGIVAIDVDTLSEEWSKKITEIVFRVLGRSAAARIGQWPKTLFLYRASVATKYRSLRFEDGVNPKKPGLVELQAGENSWVVINGIHPVTEQPYRWPEGVPDAGDLPFITAEKLEEFFAELKGILPLSKVSGGGGVDGEVDQRKLVAENTRALVSAMLAVKNDLSKIGYRQWIEMAAALHGALPNNLGLAEKLFERFTERGHFPNPQCNTYKMFWSVNPPFKLGAQYIFDKAAESGWKISRRWFDTSVRERATAKPAPQTPGADDASQRGGQGPQDTIPEDYDGPPPPLDDDYGYEDEGPPPPAGGSIFDTIDGQDEDDKPRTWKLTPARLPLPASIEPREWLYGKFLIRQRVALTVAPSETGKTGIGIVEALALASGKSLLGIHPFGPLRVAIWNGEDPLEELERRVAATMQLYRLTNEDLGGRLFLDSGFGKGGLAMEVASISRTGLVMNQPQIRAFTKALMDNQIDVQLLDPFVSVHAVGENDNNSVDKVSKTFAGVAEEANCAVHLFHHTRKGSGAQHDMTVDDARGAGSLGATVRTRDAYQTMQPDEAMELGIELRRRKFYFRLADSGNNMAAPDEDSAMWFEMRNVILPNGRNIPGRPPDEVGVPIRWRPDATKSILPADVLDRILAEVDTKQWRQSHISPFWIGHLIAREQRLDISKAENKKFIRRVIDKMLKDGLIKTTEVKGANRHMTVIYIRGDKPTGVFV
jgi:hypothetical protein